MFEGTAMGADPLAAVPAFTSPIPTFELLLTIMHPPKRVRTANRKTKTIKATSENKGPFDIPVDAVWATFLGTIAEKLAVQPPDLVITSFEWHWLKPASSPWLPVQDESGFASMLKKIRAKSEAYIIIRMHVPLQRRAAGSSGNTWGGEDEFESDVEENSVAKKVRITHHLPNICTDFLAGKAR